MSMKSYKIKLQRFESDEVGMAAKILGEDEFYFKSEADTKITTLTAKLKAAENALEQSVESIMIFTYAINALATRINPIDPDGVAKDAIDKAEIALQEAK